MIPVPMLATELAEALNFAMAFAVLVGAFSVRVWDRLSELPRLYRAHRRRLARRRRYLGA